MEQGEKNFRSTLGGLEAFAVFLNLDLDSPDPEVLEKVEEELKQFPLWAYMVKDALRDVGKAKRVQSELKRILTPIIPPVKADSATEAYDLIWKLLKEINKMRFQTGWVVDPVEHTWIGVGDPGAGRMELVRKEPEEIEKTSEFLVSPQRELNILGYRWSFGRNPQGITLGFSRENLYLIILDALESGEFSRLKRCQWKDCQVFFVAEPPSRKFCSDEHTQEADKKEAARRVIEGRKEDRDRKARKSWRAGERKGCELLLKLMKQARKGKIDREKLTRRKSLVGALEQWQEGTSLNEIWTGLPDGVKETFRRFEGPKVKVARRPRKARGA